MQALESETAQQEAVDKNLGNSFPCKIKEINAQGSISCRYSQMSVAKRGAKEWRDQ